MTVQIRVTEDGLVVSGELDYEAADDFREYAASNVDGSREVVLDIAELAFLDSAGARAIMRLAALSCPQGLVLHHPRANVRRIFDILRIEDVVGIRVE